MEDSIWKALSTVRILDITGSNTGGFLPPGLDYLTSLTNLSLGGNAFEGSLPTLAGLKNLTVISLGSNRLTGTSWDRVPIW